MPVLHPRCSKAGSQGSSNQHGNTGKAKRIAFNGAICLKRKENFPFFLLNFTFTYRKVRMPLPKVLLVQMGNGQGTRIPASNCIVPLMEGRVVVVMERISRLFIQHGLISPRGFVTVSKALKQPLELLRTMPFIWQNPGNWFLFTL